MSFEYESNVDLDQAAERIADATQVTLITHAKPDGDAFGSVAALAAALRLAGGEVAARLMGPVSGSLETLRGMEHVKLYHDGDPLPESELLVIVDTGAYSQVEPVREQVEAHCDQTLILDHHLSGDIEAKWRYIDSEAAAACEIVAEVIRRIHAPALEDPTVTESLFVGLASDTGWFRFSNTRPQTHHLAAELLAAGVDQADIYRRLEQAERPEKLALIARALHSLDLLADGQFAVMTLTSDDFAQTGARPEETERIIDLPQVLMGVKVAVLITESSDGGGPVRVSFRSKAVDHPVDVSAVAQSLGGGGHARAAGAKMEGTVDEVRQRVREAVAEAIKAATPSSD